MQQCPIAHGYDPLERNTVLDPYPVFNRLRDEGPVFFMPELDHYIVTKYDDVEKILLDRDTWSAANASSPLLPICQAAQDVLAQGYHRVPTLNNSDPPRHPLMRKSLLSVITPRRLNDLEPVLRAYCENLVLGIKDEPVIDFVDRLAFPFPGFAAFSLLGFPPEDTEMLKDWSAKRVLLTYGRLSDEQQVEIAEIICKFWKYCEDHVADNRANRRDNIVSELVTLADAKPEQLNDFDIVNMVYSMALAGHETTCNTIGNGTRALLTDRAQYEALIADPTKIPNAVEEILRYDGPVLNHRRVAKVDTEVSGVSIPAGAKVMMCFASADHDPAVFENPDAFLIERDNADLHLAFGKGAHFCLGAALGRLEVRIILDLLTTHCPNLELVPDQVVEYSPNALFRGPLAMQVAPGGLARVK